MKKNQGSALIAVLVAMALVIITAASLISVTQSEFIMAKSSNDYNGAYYIAEAGIERSLSIIRNDYINYYNNNVNVTSGKVEDIKAALDSFGNPYLSGFTSNSTLFSYQNSIDRDFFTSQNNMPSYYTINSLAYNSSTIQKNSDDSFTYIVPVTIVSTGRIGNNMKQITASFNLLFTDGMITGTGNGNAYPDLDLFFNNAITAINTESTAESCDFSGSAQVTGNMLININNDVNFSGSGSSFNGNVVISANNLDMPGDTTISGNNILIKLKGDLTLDGSGNIKSNNGNNVIIANNMYIPGATKISGINNIINLTGNLTFDGSGSITGNTAISANNITFTGSPSINGDNIKFDIAYLFRMDGGNIIGKTAINSSSIAMGTAKGYATLGGIYSYLNASSTNINKNQTSISSGTIYSNQPIPFTYKKLTDFKDTLWVPPNVSTDAGSYEIKPVQNKIEDYDDIDIYSFSGNKTINWSFRQSSENVKVVIVRGDLTIDQCPFQGNVFFYSTGTITVNSSIPHGVVRGKKVIKNSTVGSLTGIDSAKIAAINNYLDAYENNNADVNGVDYFYLTPNSNGKIVLDYAYFTFLNSSNYKVFVLNGEMITQNNFTLNGVNVFYSNNNIDYEGSMTGIIIGKSVDISGSGSVTLPSGFDANKMNSIKAYITSVTETTTGNEQNTLLKDLKTSFNATGWQY